MIFYIKGAKIIEFIRPCTIFGITFKTIQFKKTNNAKIVKIV